MMVLGGTEGRFSVRAVLPVAVTVETVEEGNQPVGGVEGSLRRVLDLTPDLSRRGRRQRRRGSRRATRGEGVNVSHGSAEALGGGF